jgi:RND family efflux transporter MFP subunit
MRLLTISLLLTALIALSACKPKTDPAGTDDSASASLRVSLVKASASSEPGSLNANGQIAARNLVLIGAELSGVRIQSVHAELGDWVQPGQLLAKLDDRVIQVELRQAGAQVAQAKASLATARADATRGAVLRKKGLVSERDVEQVQAALLSAQAQIEIANANKAAVALRLSFTDIRAPQKGWISARSAQAGQLLTPGTNLFTLIENGELEWRAEVFEQDLNRISIGTAVELLPPQSQQQKKPGYSESSQVILIGKVRSLGVEVDPAKRTVLVLVQLNWPAMRRQASDSYGVQAGSYANGRFILKSEPILTLPSAAIVERDGYSYVYVAIADPAKPGLSTAKSVRVEIVKRMGTRVALAQSGGFSFDASQSVIASGGGFLADGDRIQVVPDAAAIPAISAPKP